ncbi:MAG TPA: DUF2333 family protein [Desulfobaccales bacterium]|nr:DUF2333 family protein [Desulfobaccales bacterium]
MTPNDTSRPGPLPAPVGPPPAGPPPGGLVHLILQHRFLVVSLVVVLFFVVLFAWGARHGASTPPKPAEPSAAAAPHDESAPSVSKELELKPLIPAPPKDAKAGDSPAILGPQGTQEPGLAPTLPKVGPSRAPAASPAVVTPSREPVKGEVFALALIKIVDDQVNKTWFGWRPNTIVFGKTGLTDNVNNLQLGVLEVARRTVVVLNEHMTRFATTEAYDPRVNEAMNFFMVSPDKYWFPSASGKYREAMQDLEKYVEGLKVGRARFYSRVDYLIALLSHYKDLLGSSYHNLIKDTEADGQAVSWSMTDDYFYYSQGIALAMSEMLEAVTKEFHQELQKKNAHKLLDDAIHALHAASHLSPWVVTNGAKDGVLANHRGNMSTYIGEAEHVISTMMSQLATN